MAAAGAAAARADEPAQETHGGDGDARLIVETTRGARVRVGDVEATAPCEIPLAAGAHRVGITLRGHHARREGVRLARGESRTLIAPLAAKTRGGAIARAALAPGWGSRYMERRGTAWALGAAGLAAATAAIVFDRQLADRTDTYDALYDAYNAAVTPEAIAARRRDAEAAFERADDAHAARGAALAALGAVYGLSILDALFRYPFGDLDVAAIDGGGAGGALEARITLLRFARARPRPAPPAR